jgi:hypothetical protein
MEKIKNLMAKCGLSDDAAGALCGAFEEHEQQMRTALEEEYQTRFAAAKKICLEETEAYKLELARRAQIFLEANAGRVEQIVAKQAQLREGQAVSLLEQLKGLLEGVTINPEEASVEAKALKESNDKLRKENAQLVATANRQTKVAESVLKRNRLLETQVALSERNDRGRAGGQGNRQAVAESAGDKRTQRIDGQRQGSGGTRPTTTRRTLNENQNRAEQTDDRTGNAQPGAARPNTMTPAQIAASIPDDPV